MESTGRAPTLPLELGHISDTRREQLESRRQREMARQQEQSQPPGADSFRWSPMAMIPAHLCVLLFLVFLLEKLEDRIDWPWAAVLSPLWITDAVFIAIKCQEVRRVLRTTVHVPSETHALFPPVGRIIDHLGVAAAKVTLAYRLQDIVDWSLLLLFTPMWACVSVAGALRCVTPPGPQVMGEQVMLHRAGAVFTGLFHLAARGAQPMLIVLKVDGQLEGPWSSVFIPLWVFMGATALGGTALCCCAPMVSRGVIPEIRPLLIRGMLLCSVGTFSLAFCALLFLVFLTLELDGNENMPPRTILAPLIALYALILVFLPLLLLATRHYARTMRTAQEQFRQAQDPNGVDGSSTFGGGPGVAAGTREGFGQAPAAEEEGRPRRRSSVMAPTILMRESSTLFRRASVSLCRRLGEADGSLVNSDILSFEPSDWNGRGIGPRSGNPTGGSSGGGVNVGGDRGSEAGPQRSSRSFHGLQDFLPQAAGMASRGSQRFTAAVTGTAGREARARFVMSAERQRAGEEKEGSPREDGVEEAGAKSSAEDERHDRCLLHGDSGTHSVTDSYDINSYGSYVDSDEENHEVGLSIDGDDDDSDRDGDGVMGAASSHPSLPTPSPEILLAFGSAHGAAAFSLHGGSGSGHGAGGLGASRHRWSVGRDGIGCSNRQDGSSSRSGAILGGNGNGNGSGNGGGNGGGDGTDMPRRVSWPGGMSTAEACAEGVVSRGEASWAAWPGIGVGGGAVADAHGDKMCYICCERSADAVLMECGHGGMCFTCAQHLANTPPSLCPVCRKTIQEVLTFGGVVTVPTGGSLKGGGKVKTPEESSGRTKSLARISGSALLDNPPASAGNTGDRRAVSGTFRRFSGPDIVGASASVAGVSGSGGGARAGGAAQREASPTGSRRISSIRRDLEAQGMSEEGGWLDPV